MTAAALTVVATATVVVQDLNLHQMKRLMRSEKVKNL